jgi:hypothetical protein
MLNRVSSLGLLGLTAPGQAALQAYGHTGLPGAQSAAQTANNLQSYGNELVSGAPQALGLPNNQRGYDLGGVGDAIRTAGATIPQLALAEVSGLNYAIEKLGAYIPQGLGYLTNAATQAGRGVVGGALYGAQNAVTSPVPQGQTYAQNLASNIQGGALAGGAIGGAGAAIEGAPGAVRNAATATKAKLGDWITGAKRDLPAEILSGEGTSDVMASAPPQFQGQTIPEIQRISQGIGPDADAAKATIQRLTVASAKEHGVDLSLGDISQDPGVRTLEQSMEGDKTVNAMRARQGAQLRQAIMDRQGEYDKAAAALPYESDAPSNGVPPTGKPLNPDIDPLHSLTPSVSEAAANGDRGANDVKGLMDNADTNPKMILASLKGQYWKNRQIGSAITNSFTDYLDGLRAKDPYAFGARIAADGTQVPVTSIDPASTIAQAKSGIAENGEVDSDIDTLLNGYLKKLSSPNTDLSYRGGKSMVSDMEDKIEDLKASGNRIAARALFQVKNQLDDAADAFALKGIGNDPEGLAAMNKGSDWFKKNTLPFVDPDSGISDIMNGKDADLAVRPLFTDASPDQFARMFGSLDSKGQAAVRAEMIGRSEDGASRMKNFQAVNLPSISRYLENRSDQLATAFGDDHTISGLSNLIRNTPRAGYQSNLNQALNAASVGKVISSNGILSKADAAVGGIVDKAMNAARVPRLFSPDLSAYTLPPASPSAPAPMAIPPSRPTLSDSSTVPTQPPQALPYEQPTLGMYPRGASTGLATRGMTPAPEYRPPTPLGGPTALSPQTPTLPPYQQATGRLNGPIYPPASRMSFVIKDGSPLAIARPTSMAEYEMLKPGTPYRSMSGALGIKP